MRSLYIVTLLSLFLLSCKSKQYTFDSLPDSQLIFGKGGGITGEITTYMLLENGQVFYHNSLTKEHKEIERLSKKEAAICFSKMEKLQLSEMNFNHPGNLYYFLEEASQDKKYRVVWGSNDHQISEACKEFYEELRTVIK